MREIKFRMWSPKPHKYFGLEQSMNCLVQQSIGLYDHTGLHGDIFEQYTGLKDKNGKEIYEGDILKDEYGNIGACYWEPCNFVFINTSGCIESGKKWEIIGNIHENPELLN